MHTELAKHILSASNGMNIYRGCTHGCIYCDSRSKCYQMKHAFEDIEVKVNAPQLLEETLRRKRKKCMIGTGSMCDSYLHAEEQLQITKQCLEVIERYGFGVAIQTKSARIMRDIDLLDRINQKAKCVVEMTLTTYDEDLCRIIEPNVSTTKERFEVLMEMKKRGIPTVVWFDPILPFINDTEDNMRGILEYARQASIYGFIYFGCGVTLRDGDREYFYEQLDRHFPGVRGQYVRRYGNAYEIVSDHNNELSRIFYQECKKNHIETNPDQVFTYMHEFPQKEEMTQMSLFDM